MIEKFKKLLKKETVRYLFIGGCTTAVNFICFAALLKWFDLNLNLANFLGIVISIIFAFFANKYYVFSGAGKGLKAVFLEFLKFVAARVITMLMELLFVWLAVEKLQYNEFLSKAVITVAVIVANYFLSKFLIFKKGDMENEN